jgi:hypothetical protein
MLWRRQPVAWGFFLIGLVLNAAGMFAPPALRFVYAFWMMLALFLGWIMSRVLLTFVFFLVVTPIGVLQRLCGKRAIEFGFKSEETTYWQSRTTPPVPSDYERQF